MTRQELIEERAYIAAMSEQEACDKYNVDRKEEVLKMLDEEKELTPDEETIVEHSASIHKEIFGRYTVYGYGH